MEQINKQEVEEFINAALLLKEDHYEEFIKLKSLTVGILIGKNKRKL